MLTRKNFTYLLSFLILSSLGIAFLSRTTAPKDYLRDFFWGSHRRSLAKAQGDLNNDGNILTVLKVKTSDTLSLEVYKNDSETGITKYLSRQVLNEKRDAHFNFQGNAVNLALLDLNHDGKLEIVSPTYDENLVPRLHVYKFDLETEAFYLLGPENLQL